jgi:hypothetical protein
MTAPEGQEPEQIETTDDVNVEEPNLVKPVFTKTKSPKVPLPELDGSTSPDEYDEDGVTGDTNDSINAPLEGLDDVNVLKGMVVRLRHENANHRKGKQEVVKERDSLKAEKLTRSKAIEKANERVLAAERIAKQYVILAAMREYDVDEEMADLIDGENEEEIFDKAKRLAGTRKQKPAYDTPTNVDLFAGKRGNPLTRKTDSGGADFLKDLMRGNF